MRWIREMGHDTRRALPYFLLSGREDGHVSGQGRIKWHGPTGETEFK